MNTSKCRACGAEIMFIKTQAGKTIPVDAQSKRFFPCQDGKDLYVMLDRSTKRGRSIAVEVDGAEIGFISHFATCPEADAFRKPRKGDRKKDAHG